MDEYRNLIKLFLNGNIAADDFQGQFLNKFADDDSLSDEQYQVLNALFFAVEDYVDIPRLRRDEDLDEEGLADQCQKAYERLAGL